MYDCKRAVEIARSHHHRMMVHIKMRKLHGNLGAIEAVIKAERETRDYYMSEARMLRYYRRG